ncbi:MAG: hypothetical protein JXD23_08060 [Spirochaetales bacterium]|nr:hypothetical protein [Spirochaetales bacterium]
MNKNKINELHNSIQHFVNRDPNSPEELLKKTPAERKEILRKYLVTYVATMDTTERRALFEDIDLEIRTAEAKKKT